MSILKNFLGKKANDAPSATTEKIRTTADHPYCITQPVAGFVCMDSSLKQLMQADFINLSDIFFESRCSGAQIPICNVLFVYCSLQDDGSAAANGLRIRDIAKLSQAHIVIVASDNAAEKYQLAIQPKNDWNANIVLVYDRNGPQFVNFFFQLFTDMYRGVTMPMAWIKLAPQNPQQENSEVPGTIMLLEAGHLTFSVDKEANS